MEKRLMRIVMFAGIIAIMAINPFEAICAPANVVIAKGTLNTNASNGSGGQNINIDVTGGSDFPYGKVKRYTLIINTGQLASAPAGKDRIEVYSGVLAGNTSYQVRVLRQDPSTGAPLPAPGIVVQPYSGTNSFIRVYRSADGFGTVPVSFNAFVEVEP
jgi:hypothetical protein